MNKNTEFEKLVLFLYQCILSLEGYDTIKVEHDVTLPCKSGATAQFDVYWEFEQAGIIHRIAIECKNYSSTVDVGKIREFGCKLQSVGNVRGIMVTRKGYQQGAKKEAAFYGISLKQFQLPDDMDWEGRIRTIEVLLTASFLCHVKPKFDFDEFWIKEQYHGIEKFPIKAFNNEIFLTKEDGTCIKSLLDLENELPRGDTPQENLEKETVFEEPTFLSVPNAEFSKFKINKISFLYDVHVSTEKMRLSADDVITGLLKDEETGEAFMLYANAEVKKVENAETRTITSD